MIKELLNDYIKNYNKMEKNNKEYKKITEERDNAKSEQMKIYEQLKNGETNAEQFNVKTEQIKEELNKIDQKMELNRIKTQLLNDNEDIIKDKMIVYIKNNIIDNYNISIGEKTAVKIDNQIKELLKDIFNDKYITIYEYNIYREYQPNQFINVYNSVDDWQKDYYTSYLYFNLNSRLYSGEYKRNELNKLYIKNGIVKYNQYSKEDQIKEDNAAEEDRRNNTQIIEDVNKKANELLKAYNKKEELINKYNKMIQQQKDIFNNHLLNNNNNYLHNIYNYFNR